MTTIYARPSEPVSPRSALAQVMTALFGGVLLFAALLIGTVAVYNARYLGHIFPGVTVAGVDVSGMTPDDAAVKLTESLTFPNTGKIVLSDGQLKWVAAPVQLGMVLDAQATAQNAYRAGRSGNILSILQTQYRTARSGVDVAPVMILDERTGQSYLQALAEQINVPVVEAKLEIHGNQVNALPGQVGRAVDVNATLAQVSAQMQTFTDGQVPLVVQEQSPQVLDASKEAATAQRLLSGPFTLALPSPAQGDPGPWTIPPEMLGSMLMVQHAATQGAGYQLSINGDSILSQLNGIANVVNRSPADARFTFNDTTRQLDLVSPAEEGRTLRIDDTIAAINAAIAKGSSSATLALDTEQPAVGNDATAESLGITGLVSQQTSYFFGSSAERIQNIATAAARFHGLLVAPGETFSMGQALGDVSLDNGYAEALIIYGNRTIKGVGGGVCQVSTTLFRTAFFGGFPIVERVPHAYRVYYYEQTASGGHDPNLAGLDATVFTPLVDLKFTNDTPYWLLMETYVNEGAHRITWKFYSTPDGRTVTWDTTGPINRVPAPDPTFEENPDLGKGQMKQIDWSAEGADVRVTRTVMRDGQVYFTDEFDTHYEAWQAVCQYGPGTQKPRALAKDLGLCQSP